MHEARAFIVFFLGLVLPTFASQSSARAETPPSVKIRSIVRGGSGCPASSIPAVVSADRERLFLVDGVLEAEAGPDVPLSAGRAFCQVTIDLEIPAGFSYAVSNEMGVRGSLELDRGVTANVEIMRYFAGDAPSGPTFEQTFQGPIASRTFAIAEPPRVIGPFSGCGSAAKPLNVKTAVRVSKLGNPEGAGSIHLAPAWGIQVLKFYWKRCS